MLESTRHSFGVYDLNFLALKTIPRFLNNTGKTLLYLVSPEDTSGNDTERRLSIAKSGRDKIHGGIKALFWMAASITLALLIGQLS